VHSDRQLARIVKACQDIPGYELFRYVDDEGNPQSIDSADVNAYLREISGQDFTAKLFRTWAATDQALVLMRRVSRDRANPTSKESDATDTKPPRADLVQVVKEIAGLLGNTPAVCRKCYIHPALIEDFESGSLEKSLAARKPRRSSGLDPDERLTLAYLEWRSKLRKSRRVASRSVRSG